MTYYTNSNQISELMKQIAEVEMKPTDNTFEWTNVTVYIFEDLFHGLCGQIPDLPWHADSIL